jgi:hypothetical protein
VQLAAVSGKYRSLREKRAEARKSLENKRKMSDAVESAGKDKENSKNKYNTLSLKNGLKGNSLTLKEAEPSLYNLPLVSTRFAYLLIFRNKI